MTHASRDDWVDDLTPALLQQPRYAVLWAVQLELDALVGLVPSAADEAFLDAGQINLRDADAACCRAWISGVIRALPTELDTSRRISMALFDRVRDVARSANRIEAVSSRNANLSEADRSRDASAPPDAERPKPGINGPAYQTEPEAISRSYYVEDRGGTRRYYDDYQRKGLAMRADNTAISSRREDLNTIRAMLTMAEARGWSEIKVAGSPTFRREAWIEAQALGLTAKGYQASALDRQEADRRRGERGRAASPGTANKAANDIRPVQTSGAGPVSRAAQIAPATLAATPASRTSQSIPLGPDGTTADPKVSGAERAPTRSRRAGNADRTQPTSVRLEAGSAKTARPQVKTRSSTETPSTPQQVANEHRKTIKAVMAELSPDGQLVLTALAEKIDRQMNKLNAEAKLETKTFAAAELLKREKREGPVVLSPELRLVAISSDAALDNKTAVSQAPALARQADPEPARRSRSR